MIPEAKVFDDIKAASCGEDFTNSTVYTIEGRDGLWRQISRDGRQGIKTPVGGAVVAHVGEIKLIELVRWNDMENRLSTLAGLEAVPVNSDGEPVAVRTA